MKSKESSLNERWSIQCKFESHMSEKLFCWWSLNVWNSRYHPPSEHRALKDKWNNLNTVRLITSVHILIHIPISERKLLRTAPLDERWKSTLTKALQQRNFPLVFNIANLSNKTPTSLSMEARMESEIWS